jgi:hypothetical protein
MYKQVLSMFYYLQSAHPQMGHNAPRQSVYAVQLEDDQQVILLSLLVQ